MGGAVLVAKHFWRCTCGTRNQRIVQRCVCGRARPAKRVAKHLPQESYVDFARANELIHGVRDESCGACGKPRTLERKCDRDHDHLTGKPRGLLCGGNQGCNVLLAKWVTPSVAAAIFAAKQFNGEPDAPRWGLLAAYLERVEAYESARP